MQRRVASAIDRVDDRTIIIRTCWTCWTASDDRLCEQPRGICMATPSCQVQGCIAAVVPSAWIGASSQQRPSHCGVTTETREMKRSAPMLLRLRMVH
jgi:hypothetical protein